MPPDLTSPLTSGALGGALSRALGLSTAVAVLVTDDALRVHEANPAARAVLGLAGRADAPWPLDDVVHPADVTRLREALRGPGDLAGPFLLRAAPGEGADPREALLVSVVRPAGTGGEPGVVLVGRNATEEVSREARVFRARRYQIVGQLTGGVAHELNNRLSTVTTFSDLLLGDAEPGSQDAEDLAEIKQAGLDSAEITRKLDLFSGGHAGGPAASFLDQVIHGLEKLLRRFVAPDVTLEILVDPACPMVRAAPIRVEEILVALVANARDAMPDGGHLSIRARAGDRTHRHPEGCAVLDVIDTGDARDVPPLSRAVEPFFSSRPPGTASGLGLTTVRGIVDELGGDLEMSTEPGRGSTVRVTLPAAPDDDDGLREAERTRPARVVLVEPDAALRGALRRSLEVMGVGVDAAPSVGELGGEIPPTAGLSDVPDRPGAGAALVRELRSRWEDLPVVLMRRRSTRHEFAGRAPGIREIVKPADAVAILSALADAAGRSAPSPDPTPAC